MPKYILKLSKDGIDRYLEWSTIVDAPTTYGLTLDEFREYYRDEYGERGMDDLPARMARVEKHGTSAIEGHTVEHIIAGNRCAESEKDAFPPKPPIVEPNGDTHEDLSWTFDEIWEFCVVRRGRAEGKDDDEGDDDEDEVDEDEVDELTEQERARSDAKLLAALHERSAVFDEIAKSIEPDYGALEDCVYRFWHQSYKVFYSKEITRRITDVLVDVSASVGCELHPWYWALIYDQKGLTFDTSMNADWPKHTRPVIDAFLHTTWILAAIRRTLAKPATSTLRGVLDYDWATILCVFRLRD